MSKLPLTTRLRDCAGQENCDDYEYGLMQEAATKIAELKIKLGTSEQLYNAYTDTIADCTKLQIGLVEARASKKVAILSAHLAGQADAGVDPSYSNAQCYLNKVEKSDG